MKEALRASFRDALDKFDTPLLWSWRCADEEEEDINREIEHNREAILDEIVHDDLWNTTNRMPDLGNMQEVWVSANPADPAATEARVIPGLFVHGRPRKKQRVAKGAAVATVAIVAPIPKEESDSSEEEEDEDEPMDEDEEEGDRGYAHACLSCGTEYEPPDDEGDPEGLPPIKCTDALCGMIANRDPEDKVNIRRGQLLLEKSEGASSGSANKAPAGAATVVSAAEVGNVFFGAASGQSSRTQTHAFAAAAKHGDPYPRFLDRSAVVAKDLAEVARARAFNGSAYIAPLPELIEYIQSGRLTNVAYALPVPCESRGDLGATGESEVSRLATLLNGTKMPAPKELMCMGDYMRAFVGTIIPALIQQPQALGDWCSLTLSMLEMEMKADGPEFRNKGTHGWRLAHSFLQRTLTNKVARRVEFGTVDFNIASELSIELAAARTSGRGGGGGGGGDRKGDKSRHGERPPGGGKGANKGEGTCHGFNSAKGCSRTDCKFKHVCSTCKGTHASVVCTKTPAAAAAKGATAANA